MKKQRTEFEFVDLSGAPIEETVLAENLERVVQQMVDTIRRGAANTRVNLV